MLRVSTNRLKQVTRCEISSGESRSKSELLKILFEEGVVVVFEAAAAAAAAGVVVLGILLAFDILALPPAPPAPLLYCDCDDEKGRRDGSGTRANLALQYLREVINSVW